MNRTYNLVSSVKGGCGKTTFSVWLTYYLSDMRIKAGGMTLLLDMDLLGTSMQYLLTGAEKEQDCLNDIFKVSRDKSRNLEKRMTLSDGVTMNVIFSSMDSTEKTKFKSGKGSSYSPVVKHSVFKKGFSEILNKNKNINGEEVQHFVFDMPPNSDGFSDVAMECVFGRKDSVVKKKDRTNLFIMVGSEMGQTVATIEELKDIFCSRGDKIPNRIFIVFNCNTKGKMEDQNYDIRKEKIIGALKDMGLAEKEKNNIYFLVMYESEAYAQKIGIDGEGLISDKIVISEVLPQLPIRKIAQMKEEKAPFKDIKADEEKELLLNLILGE